MFLAAAKRDYNLKQSLWSPLRVRECPLKEGRFISDIYCIDLPPTPAPASWAEPVLAALLRDPMEATQVILMWPASVKWCGVRVRLRADWEE